MKWVVRILGVLAGVLLLGVVVLFAMGQRAGAGQMRGSIELNAPPERVWAWITETDKLKQWVSWLVEIRGEGKERVWVMSDQNNGGKLMELHCNFVEETPPRRLRVSMSEATMVDGDQTYDLTDIGGGRTRLETVGTYRFSMWFSKLLEPLIMPSAEKKLVGDLARLKAKLEENPR